MRVATCEVCDACVRNENTKQMRWAHEWIVGSHSSALCVQKTQNKTMRAQVGRGTTFAA